MLMLTVSGKTLKAQYSCVSVDRDLQEVDFNVQVIPVDLCIICKFTYSSFLYDSYSSRSLPQCSL